MVDEGWEVADQQSCDVVLEKSERGVVGVRVLRGAAANEESAAG